KFLDTFDAPLFKSVQNHFTVGVICFPLVSAKSFQFGADLRIIVNLTIEHEPQRSVFVTHRLARRLREIDDRQATVPQPNPAILRNPRARTIWSSVDHSVPHPLDIMPGRAELAVFKRQNADYSAHESLSVLSALIGAWFLSLPETSPTKVQKTLWNDIYEFLLRLERTTAEVCGRYKVRCKRDHDCFQSNASSPGRAAKYSTR